MVGGQNFGQYYPSANTGFVQQAPQHTQSTMSSLGLPTVSGIDGVNRWPLAPGQSVTLKDASRDIVFFKACDAAGSILPIQVYSISNITEDFLKSESPVTRKEFMELQTSIASLNKLLEDLTAPTSGAQLSGGESK